MTPFIDFTSANCQLPRAMRHVAWGMRQGQVASGRSHQATAMNHVVWVRVRCVFSNLWLYYNDHLICLRQWYNPKPEPVHLLSSICLPPVSLLLIACLGFCMFDISTGISRWSTVAEATPRRMYAPCSTLAARRSRLKAPAIVWIVRILNILWK